MAEDEFIPNAPYVFRSGNRREKSLEILMFQDYGFLKWYLNKLDSMRGKRKNLLHQHLDWLVRQGENRTAKALCQKCGHERPIRIFSAWGSERYGYMINLFYACCGRPECKEMLETQEFGKPFFLPLKFSSILRFRRKTDQQSVVHLLRTAHQLPERLTAESAFRFFSEP